MKRAKKSRRTPRAAERAARSTQVSRRKLRWPGSGWVWAPLVLLHLAFGVVAAKRVGMTTDEMAHAATGYTAWTRGDFRLDPIHPPLARLWLSWPLLLQDLRPVAFGPEHLRWNKFVPPLRRWIHQTHDARGLLFWPRVINLLWTAGLAAGVWWWLRRYGAVAAALGGAIVALSPNLLAHGSLATTDAALVACFSLATVALARLSRCVSPANLLLGGLGVGAAILCKFSGLLIVPVGVGIGVARAATGMPVHWRWGRRATLRAARHKVPALILAAIAVGVQACVLVWAVYGFRYSAGPAAPKVVFDSATGPHLTPDYWEVPPEKQGVVQRALFAVRDAHLLPEAYVYGVTTLLLREADREAFLLGQYKPKGGWWYYFPVAMMLKTPLASLVVLLGGVVLAIKGLCRPGHFRIVSPGRRPKRRWLRAGLASGSVGWPAGVAALIFAIAAMRSPMNIGLRHFLPVLPLLVMVAVPAFVAALKEVKHGALLAAGVVVWLLAADLAVCPHFLSFFNLLAGGPSNGHRYLADSNIDWGQGLPELAEYQRDHATGPVTLFYLGFDDPQEYGIVTRPPYQRGRPPNVWSPGIYVVSVNYAKGIGVPAWTADHDQVYAALWDMASSGRLGPREAPVLARYCWQRFLVRLRVLDLPPDDRAGPSLFVYDLDANELARLLAPG